MTEPVDLIAQLTRERDEALAALELEISLRTLGGTPPGYQEHWTNEALGSPESAASPDAPPLNRWEGSSSHA